MLFYTRSAIQWNQKCDKVPTNREAVWKAISTTDTSGLTPTEYPLQYLSIILCILSLTMCTCQVGLAMYPKVKKVTVGLILISVSIIGILTIVVFIMGLLAYSFNQKISLLLENYS